MPVYVDFNKCDNAKECSGIAVCPTGALYYKDGIKVDNSKCTSCGLCEKECSVGALHVAKDDIELQKLKESLRTDEVKVKSLFVERYGAIPVEETSILEEDKVEGFVIGKNIMIELFNEDDIKCLFGSIPSKEIMGDFEYKKVEVKNNLFDVKEFPTLLIFENGELKGKVEGYFSRVEKDIMLKKIKEMMK
jgi:ferredoxin